MTRSDSTHLLTSARVPIENLSRHVVEHGFRYLVGALFAAVTLPRMIQRGMFLDGITYAVVARNMASGVGTFWRPSFSDTSYATFFEQPPLGLGLEAIAFWLLGDHLFVERLYSILVLVVTAFLMLAIWRKVVRPGYDWLPFAFWVLPSVVTWGVVNNMLENTQGMFTTLAVVCLIYGAGAHRLRTASAWTCAAGMAVVAAFLTKGPVGLFPLAVPPLFALLGAAREPLATRRWRIWILLLLFTGGLAASLFVFEAPRHSIVEFGRTHLVPALQGDRGLPRRAADVSRHLTLGIWARMAALALVVWAIRRRRQPIARIDPAGLFFFATGLAASLPILVSPVLAGHYFIPSVPFFALSAAIVTLPAVESFNAPREVGVRRFVPIAIAGALVATAIIVVLIHGPIERRDTELIASLDTIERFAPVGATVGSCVSASTEWGLKSYLQRFYRISVKSEGEPSAGWFVIKGQACGVPSGCALVSGDSIVRLYRCDVVAENTRPLER
jgi:4-amino-4-deoxy-L-arabinose transferase-like glycosyltransferase